MHISTGRHKLGGTKPRAPTLAALARDVISVPPVLLKKSFGINAASVFVGNRNPALINSGRQWASGAVETKHTFQGIDHGMPRVGRPLAEQGAQNIALSTGQLVLERKVLSCRASGLLFVVCAGS